MFGEQPATCDYRAHSVARPGPKAQRIRFRRGYVRTFGCKVMEAFFVTEDRSGTSVNARERPFSARLALVSAR